MNSDVASRVVVTVSLSASKMSSAPLRPLTRLPMTYFERTIAWLRKRMSALVTSWALARRIVRMMLPVSASQAPMAEAIAASCWIISLMTDCNSPTAGREPQASGAWNV